MDSSLTSIDIPQSVTKIAARAFSGCSSLASINIPAMVTSIENYAFENCSSLKGIDIPCNVTSIGQGAFRGCVGMERIVVDAQNATYDSREDCNAIIETASNTLLAGCNTSSIPNGVDAIGSFAFYECTGLSEITIPASVTSIGSNAFSGCSNLKNVTNLSPAPQAIDNSVFSLYGTLHVTQGYGDVYKSTPFWQKFTIVEDIADGIGILKVENGGHKDIKGIYDLSGKRVGPIRPGVNIIRMSDGSTRKVVKK